MDLVKEISNKGSLSEIIRFKQNTSGLILNKGESHSRIFKIEGGLDYEPIFTLQTEGTVRIEAVWPIGSGEFVL